MGVIMAWHNHKESGVSWRCIRETSNKEFGGFLKQRFQQKSNRDRNKFKQENIKDFTRTKSFYYFCYRFWGFQID